MKKSKFTEEQIAFALRQAESGTSVAEVYRKLGVSEQTYYRWRKEYNRFRPHSSLGYRPPAPEAYLAGKFTQGLVH